MLEVFPYDLAFDRNLGLLTDWEQLALRAKRVAIAGLGGVGGSDLLTLARLGIGAFTIADFDRFEFVNFNRQIGAAVQTVGHAKTAVLEEMARAINPELRIRRLDGGVTTAAIDDFLSGADLFVDGFDFFELGVRRQVFARCAEMGIPAITAAPIGMGVGFIAFLPNSMSFERYFRLDGRSEPEQYGTLPARPDPSCHAPPIPGGPNTGRPGATEGAFDGCRLPIVCRRHRSGGHQAAARSWRCDACPI